MENHDCQHPKGIRHVGGGGAGGKYSQFVSIQNKALLCIKKIIYNLLNRNNCKFGEKIFLQRSSVTCATAAFSPGSTVCSPRLNRS